jgi:prevent-host-death family protein
MGAKQMIRQLGTREARKHLAEVLARAASGTVTVIMSRGRPVAAVISGQCAGKDIDAARAATAGKVPFEEAMEEVGKEDAKALRELARR